MIIKGQLIAFQKDENIKKVLDSNRQLSHFNYYYNNIISVCHTIYEALVRVNHKYIDTLIQHLREYDLEKCIHGNTGRASKNMKHFKVNYSIACKIHEFLKNYADIYGLPLPE